MVISLSVEWSLMTVVNNIHDVDPVGWTTVEFMRTVIWIHGRGRGPRERVGRLLTIVSEGRRAD